MTRRSWALFAALCVIWGVPYLLIRVAVRDVAPGTLVFLRTAIGGVALLPLALRTGGFGTVLRHWRPVLAFSVLEMAVPWLLLSDAERHLSSSMSGLLVAAVPLVGVVVARVSGAHERVDRLQLAGLLVGVLGVAMLVGLDLGRLPVGGLVEVAVVVAGYALGPVVMARSLADLPSVAVACTSLLVVAVGYLPYAALRPPRHATAHTWWSVVTLGIVCTALAFVLFFALIAAIGPARATVITYVNPAVAVLLGVLFLGEPFTPGIGVGFPLVLAGSVLAARRRTAQRLVEPEATLATECAAGPADQSMRTVPVAVSNSAATRPEPANGSTQTTSTSPSGSSAEMPR